MWNISQTFKERLGDPVQSIRVRCEIMDTDFNTVSAVGGGGPDKGIIDGMVDLDTSRGTRRTVVMSLLNQDGEFSPTSQWGGIFYVNRMIRLYRGLVVGTSGTGEKIEYVPIGTFLVDKTETLVERGMSTVILSGSDLWKKFNKSQFVQPARYLKGMMLNDFIKSLADDAGVTRMVLDSLVNRTASSDRLQASVNFEKGETRGDALKKICGDYGIDIYFDPLGRLVTHDTEDTEDAAVVWQFGQTDQYPQLAYFIRSVTDDDRLYNHVFVTGTANEEVIYTAERKNTDPTSPTNIDRIGDRVYRMESGVLASQESVNKAADSLFLSTRLMRHDLAMETICNPALEGEDVFELIETDYTHTIKRFRIATLNVPLLTSKQKITGTRLINLSD